MTNQSPIPDFSDLVPHVILDAVEQATGTTMTGMANSLPSYVNRVYEVETLEGEHLVAKFYRPGRWSIDAIQEEHDFVSDCADADIPVVAPMLLENGTTIEEVEGIHFAVFPKRAGRPFEINNDNDWLRVGRLIGRVHVAGAGKQALNRTDIHPGKSTHGHIRHLIDNGFVTPQCQSGFEDVAMSILELITPLFEDIEFIRIHGDCHCGNLLHRPGEEGIIIIDFDDMMIGPAVQDLWLLLPDHANRCRRELDILLRGYEMFTEFDDRTLRLIEPLRAMRIIYFLAWCSIQVDDYRFNTNNPDWGTNAFWEREIRDLSAQLEVIREHI